MNPVIAASLLTLLAAVPEQAKPGPDLILRGAAIYTKRRFSDHAPLIIDYNYELTV